MITMINRRYFFKELKYSFGNTYGEATRQLPVCNQTSGSFGKYMDENPPKGVIC